MFIAAKAAAGVGVTGREGIDGTEGTPSLCSGVVVAGAVICAEAKEGGVICPTPSAAAGMDGMGAA